MGGVSISGKIGVGVDVDLFRDMSLSAGYPIHFKDGKWELKPTVLLTSRKYIHFGSPPSGPKEISENPYDALRLASERGWAVPEVSEVTRAYWEKETIYERAYLGGFGLNSTRFFYFPKSFFKAVGVGLETSLQFGTFRRYYDQVVSIDFRDEEENVQIYEEWKEEHQVFGGIFQVEGGLRFQRNDSLALMLEFSLIRGMAVGKDKILRGAFQTEFPFEGNIGVIVTWGGNKAIKKRIEWDSLEEKGNNLLAEGNRAADYPEDWDDALASYQKALEATERQLLLVKDDSARPTKQKLFAIRQKISHAQLQRKDFVLEIDDLQHFIRKYPDYIVGLYDLGYFLVETGGYLPAIHHLKLFIQKGLPSKIPPALIAKAHFHLARAYWGWIHHDKYQGNKNADLVLTLQALYKALSTNDLGKDVKAAQSLHKLAEEELGSK